MRPYRVLSIDGGGIRGLYTAVLLLELAKRFNTASAQSTEGLDVGRAFDLIVGTSTGALLATALAAGVSLEKIVNLYHSRAGEIFAHPTPPETKKMRLLWWIKHNLSKPANDGKALRTALADVLGEETMGELFERRQIALCVPAVNGETHKSWVYKTPHDRQNNRLTRDNHYRLVDVCMSSSAAPIILPIHGVEKPNDPTGHKNWFVDGGLWANNPVMVALTEALSFAPKDAPIEVISVSTCPPFKAPSISEENNLRGLKAWRGGIGIMEMALDAQAAAYDYMAKTLATELRDRVSYVRLTDPTVSSQISSELRMDNPSQECLKALVRLGHDAADINISEATTGARPKALIKDVFSSLFPVERRQGPFKSQLENGHV